MRPVRTKIAATVLGVVALGALVGCGTTRTPAPPATSHATASNQAAGFPVTINSGGRTVTMTAPPRRIVSLSPALTEMLYAIGAGSQVAAVDELSDYPAQAPRTKLSGFKPNAEAVIGYRPDLVVISNDTDGIGAQLTAVKIPVLVEPAAATLDDSYREMTELGRVTGHPDQAARAVEGIKRQLADLAARTRKPSHPLTYYHELDPTLYTATSKTFVGQVYALFGLRNIADAADRQGSGYPKLSAEYLLKADPDLIFLADTKCCGQSAATVSKRPGWQRVAAVRAGAVVPLDDDVASRWGPRVVDFARAVADAVSRAAASGGSPG